MANKTTNYNLTKPSAEDFYNVEDQNGNMDIIDAELKNLDEKKAPSGHGLGDSGAIAGSIPLKEVMRNGCGFYQVGHPDDSPLPSGEWMGLIQMVRNPNENTEGGTQLAFYDFSTSAPRMWMRNLINGSTSEWVEMIHTGNLHELGVPKIVTGSYVGNGNHGKSSPTSITFDFEPKLVILNGVVTAIRGMSEVQYYSTQLRSLKLTWSGNTLTWYCTEGANWQFNSSGTTYHWAAIG